MGQKEARPGGESAAEGGTREGWEEPALIGLWETVFNDDTDQGDAGGMRGGAVWIGGVDIYGAVLSADSYGASTAGGEAGPARDLDLGDSWGGVVCRGAFDVVVWFAMGCEGGHV